MLKEAMYHPGSPIPVEPELALATSPFLFRGHRRYHAKVAPNLCRLALSLALLSTLGTGVAKTAPL